MKVNRPDIEISGPLAPGRSSVRSPDTAIKVDLNRQSAYNVLGANAEGSFVRHSRESRVV